MDDNSTQTRLYVAGLNWDMTEDQFRTLFEECGAVKDLKLMPSKFGDKGNGGYGFITMADEAGVEKAKALNGTEQMGREIKVEIARPRREGGDDRGGRDRDRGDRGGYGRDR